MDNKLSRAFHYLIYLSQERHWPMGATKLLKSVVFSEAASLYHRRRPLTGVKIVKGPYGPIPDQYEEHLEWLKNAGRIRIKEGVQTYDTTTYESLSAPDLSIFEAQELEIMAENGELCCKKYTAVALSKLTHGYYWRIIGVGEEIPLAAYLDPEDVAELPLSAEEETQLDMAAHKDSLHA